MVQSSEGESTRAASAIATVAKTFAGRYPPDPVLQPRAREAWNTIHAASIPCSEATGPRWWICSLFCHRNSGGKRMALPYRMPWSSRTLAIHNPLSWMKRCQRATVQCPRRRDGRSNGWTLHLFQSHPILGARKVFSQSKVQWRLVGMGRECTTGGSQQIMSGMRGQLKSGGRSCRGKPCWFERSLRR